MLFRLLLLFTIVPLVELALLIEVGKRIDVVPTIALVVVTGVVGAALARHEGLRTFRSIQSDLAAGRLPGDRLIDALLILVAGVLLVTPGIITDGIGFLLLLPPARSLVRSHLKNRFRTRFSMVDMTNLHPPGGDDFIDVEAHPPDDP